MKILECNASSLINRITMLCSFNVQNVSIPARNHREIASEEDIATTTDHPAPERARSTGPYDPLNGGAARLMVGSYSWANVNPGPHPLWP